MGQNQSMPGGDKPDDKKEKKKWEPPAAPTRVGKKQKKHRGPDVGTRLPAITPNSKCKLRLLKLERVKDYLLMEEEFVTNQERLKPQEQKNEEDRSKVRSSGFEKGPDRSARGPRDWVSRLWPVRGLCLWAC
jgi:26S proteasome regulatory subunit T2